MAMAWPQDGASSASALAASVRRERDAPETPRQPRTPRGAASVEFTTGVEVGGWGLLGGGRHQASHVTARGFTLNDVLGGRPVDRRHCGLHPSLFIRGLRLDRSARNL